MTKAQDLIDYYRTPKLAINPKFQSFFDEVYKLSSLEMHAKINKLTKGFNRLDQLIGMYNLYNSYVHFKSKWEQVSKTMNEDEFTLFKRKNDIVKSNELMLITLHKNELVFESYELLKYPNIDVYKRQTFSDILEQLIKSEHDKIKPQQNEITEIVDLNKNTTAEPTTYEPKPCFNTEFIESITKDLNAFFVDTQHAELKRIIKTGSSTVDKLLFRDNGNRLTDYFRLLYKVDIITGCDKKDLINWIVDNFKYTNQKKQKDYLYKTVEKIISSKHQHCRNAIIEENSNKYVKF